MTTISQEMARDTPRYGQSEALVGEDKTGSYNGRKLLSIVWSRGLDSASREAIR